MRSRTGCLTCRARKLKCDERRPRCQNCQKAKRECRPSDGIVFRHQQNASMNGTGGGSGGDGNLPGFYSYKNTFSPDSVWLEIPKKVTFVDVTDPYAEDPVDPTPTAPDVSMSAPLRADWAPSATYRSRSGEFAAHGLEALSAAASRDRGSFQQPQPSHHDMASTAISYMTQNLHHSPSSPISTRRHMHMSTSPAASIDSTANINFLLNPQSSLSPPIDPNLQNPAEQRQSSLSMSALRPESSAEQPVESDQEVAYLLRHFAEAPGSWMDLFDSGTYFSSHVPIKALAHPLIKCAACACAAKQLGRMSDTRDTAAGGHHVEAELGSRLSAGRIDWYYCGAKYYDKAIQLLMKTLQGDGHVSDPICDREISHENQRSVSEGPQDRNPISDAKSDQVLAATAILCVYEFLDASGPAWNRHLSGTKSLLDVARKQMTAADEDSWPPAPHSLFSAARRAIFWNFARQDYLSGLINETQSRLNTEDLGLWKAAGLPLDDMGFVTSSKKVGALDDANRTLVREDMLSNALVWLLAKISNFIAAGENLTVGLEPGSDTSSPIGVSQQTLLQRWERLNLELQVWHKSLPDTFAPCARVPASRTELQGQLSQIWYSIPMCASAMQNYHMAKILLSINKPHESTARRSTVTARLKSYSLIANTTCYHAREICGISLSRLEGSAQVHSLQPLFVAGQCFTEPQERALVLDLLREIESERGCATEFRVKQLLKEWNWEDT